MSKHRHPMIGTPLRVLFAVVAERSVAGADPRPLRAYIKWSQYEANVRQMRENRSKVESRGAVRRGRVLLTGLVVCSRCGYRMLTRYGKASAGVDLLGRRPAKLRAPAAARAAA